MQNTQGKTRRQHVMERVLGDVLRMHAEDRLIRASILDFRAKLENQCKVFPVYTLLRASIHDFRAKLENRCKVFPVYTIFRASILDFKPRLANRCSIIVVAIENGPPAAAVAARENGPPAECRGGCRRGQSATEAA